MLLQIFWVFTKVALFSWGGGPASMGLMQRETVGLDWVSETEFADALAVSNALPGPVAVKVPTYIGYKLAGVAGAIAGMAGSVLPTFLLMLLVVILFFSIKDSPQAKAMLTAVRPLIVGLLLWTTYDVAVKVFNADKAGWGKGLTQNWSQAIIMVVSFLLLTFTRISPIWLVLAAAAVGMIIYR
ncbi:MAG: chromate transporter [Anaerolineales bacterium]|nr:chromate transporter [Anaerolineales bacterium]